MKAYAKQAKDTQLLRHAREIKLRAEGDLLKELKVNGQYGKGKRKSLTDRDLKTQDDLRITHDESADWQKLSDITPDNFEHAMNEALESGPHVGALTVIEIAKQKVEEDPLPPEEIDRIKAVRAADGERVKLCMPIKEALKILAEHPLSPEDAATRPGLFKGTESLLKNGWAGPRLLLTIILAAATDGDVERSKRSKRIGNWPSAASRR